MCDYGDWKESIWKHLENYKVSVLGIPGKGMEGDKEYGHVLPCGTYFMNYMGEAALLHGNKIKKHPYWYYLSSSQTMCINFFAPMVESKDYKLLNKFLAFLDIRAQIVDAQFEYTPVSNESNYDFYCRGNDGSQFFFEIKYTEPGVDKEGGGKNPSKTFQERYLPFVEKNPIFNGCQKIEELFMEKHYQAYRNMMRANDRDYSFFITMKKNEKTETELQASLKDLNLRKGENSHIKLLHWEEIVPKWIAFLSEKGGKGEAVSPQIKGYYREFQRKYLPEK